MTAEALIAARDTKARPLSAGQLIEKIVGDASLKLSNAGCSPRMAAAVLAFVELDAEVETALDAYDNAQAAHYAARVRKPEAPGYDDAFAVEVKAAADRAEKRSEKALTEHRRRLSAWEKDDRALRRSTGLADAEKAQDRLLDKLADVTTLIIEIPCRTPDDFRVKAALVRRTEYRDHRQAVLDELIGFLGRKGLFSDEAGAPS